jgi:hypothetical protein
MRRILILIFGLLFAVQWTQAAAGWMDQPFVPAEVDSGGPDPFGYTWKDSFDPGGPIYAWKDISAVGALVTGLGDDNYVGPFPIGFTFGYYWFNVSQYWIFSNGYISFSQPSLPPNYSSLNCFKADLTFENGGQCRRWNNQDSLVISFLNVPAWMSGGSHTFQLILDRLTGDITYQYGAQTGSVNPTIGIESPGLYSTLYYMINQNPVPNSAVTFYYPTTAPALDVTLTPLNAPINIPANGGSFQFNAAVQRTAGPQAPFAVWARMKQPDGTWTMPLLGPVNLNPTIGVQVSRLRAQYIPASWPPGTYTYMGYANSTYSYPAIDSSGFNLVKLATGSGPLVWDWGCYGEPFPGERSMTVPIPAGLDLAVSPNPFNPTTSISYQLQAASHVSLRVYAISGGLVATLVDDWREVGTHQAIFNGSGLATGLYLYSLSAGSHHAEGKLVLVR